MLTATLFLLTLQVGAPPGKLVTPLHFGANIEFFRPGLVAGVSSRREAFANALRESGVRVLRLPGGNAAYYYLPESRSATLRLAHATNHWEFREDAPPNTGFVTLDQLASFCRESGVRIIYELPCLFYLDGETPRAIVRSRLSDQARNYDRERVSEGVAYGMGILRRLRELKAPIAAWELGNEEFGYCAVEDYARVVAEYLPAIRAADPNTPVLVVGMDFFDRLVPLLRQAGVLSGIHSFQAHYPFGNWPGPDKPERKGDPPAFVGGDLKMERWLDAFEKSKKGLGLEGMPTSVTETTVMHIEGWDPFPIIGTHAHALCYAWNWMTLLERPEVAVAVFHDLETPFFGLMRYDVGFDPAARRFVWPATLPEAEREGLRPRFPGQYVVSPTGCANRLLGELIGEELVPAPFAPTPELRALASQNRLVAVNRSEKPAELRIPFAAVSAEALTADSLSAALPGTFRTAPLSVRVEHAATQVTLPPWSVAAFRAASKGE